MGNCCSSLFPCFSSVGRHEQILYHQPHGRDTNRNINTNTHGNIQGPTFHDVSHFSNPLPPSVPLTLPLTVRPLPKRKTQQDKIINNQVEEEVESEEEELSDSDTLTDSPSSASVPPSPSSSLSPSSLFSSSFHSLGWRLLNAAPGSPQSQFYFNAVSSKTQWDTPSDLLQLKPGDLALPALLDDFPDLRSASDYHGVNIRFLEPGEKDADYPGIKATPPMLVPTLFYRYLLLSELALYPYPFYRRSLPLRAIVLCGGLTYHGQKRLAIPNPISGILYLHACIEEIYYLQGVLHHEIYHLIDYHTCLRGLYRVNNQGNEADKQNNKSLNINDLPDQDWLALNVAGFRYGSGGDAHRASELSLPATAQSRAAYKQAIMDRRNGRGGDNEEKSTDSHSPVHCHDLASVFGQHATCAGFLNGYSMSSKEEDKAEIYSALFRMGGRLMLNKQTRDIADAMKPPIIWPHDEGDDADHAIHSAIVYRKASLIRDRLSRLAPACDAHWWAAVERHRPGEEYYNDAPAAAGGKHDEDEYTAHESAAVAWVSHVSPAGLPYWFNPSTMQTSWINPAIREKQKKSGH